MNKPSTRIGRRLQAGFTLIELVVVIVIIGILAAVAIPSLTGVSDQAQIAKNTATLGALKSAWSSAFAVARAAPSVAAVAAQMSDPTCTVAGTVITCGTAATITTTFTAAADPILTPAGITCTTATLCN